MSHTIDTIPKQHIT